ncbi:MAG: glutathione S- transferase, nitrogen catabolite repression regulator [Icmadophila ericetorum]|nr:glutathione S- transferase, nitrogen catabolite repression regulator [Icmadophila ericetorum]
MADLKPITLYTSNQSNLPLPRPPLPLQIPPILISSSTTHQSNSPLSSPQPAGGPNPHKVVLIFLELSLPYKEEIIQGKDLHTPIYEKINPNGRVPAIYDPNTDVTLWESGAIVEYLIDTYDKEAKLTYTTSPEKFLLKQWLMFQMSGQGPYFGQAAWFTFYHHEKLPSAVTRYRNEVLRVCAVREAALEGKEYLVGDKCTYADLSFVIWDASLSMFFAGDPETGEGKVDFEKDYPNFWAWHQRLCQRESVKQCLEEINALRAKRAAAAAAQK